MHLKAAYSAASKAEWMAVRMAALTVACLVELTATKTVEWRAVALVH